MQAHFSEFDMDVRDIPSTEQTEALLADEIDIGMACLLRRHSAVSAACKLDDTLCVALRRQDPRAREELLALQQFVEDRFAAFTEQSWLARGDRPDPAFAEAGFQPYVHYEVTTVHRVLDLVAGGWLWRCSHQSLQCTCQKRSHCDQCAIRLAAMPWACCAGERTATRYWIP
ncbi:LysR substrate-binding domain-containing protein [Eleftheria terrae]|nr:LysR substrate-binding domain-containing protein [Eleftheria terrae]WKB55104.1 LysR substrate-binding domain-containing protein [Eleftheria terrae]